MRFVRQATRRRACVTSIAAIVSCSIGLGSAFGQQMPDDGQWTVMRDDEREVCDDGQGSVPMLSLHGQSLAEPLPVPDVLNLCECATTNSRSWIDIEVFELSDGRVFVSMGNVFCSVGCQLFDPITGEFSNPEGGCLGGYASQIEPLWDDVYLVTHTYEGGADVRVVEYSPEAGESEPLLTYNLSVTAGLTQDVGEGSLSFSTVCKMEDGGCHYQDYDGYPTRHYFWSPEDGLELLDPE